MKTGDLGFVYIYNPRVTFTTIWKTTPDLLDVTNEINDGIAVKHGDVVLILGKVFEHYIVFESKRQFIGFIYEKLIRHDI